jgi:flagellar biosynthetic protein FliQ
VSTPAALLVLRVLREGLVLVLVLSGPPLLASLLAGFLLGVFQGATQIHDVSLSFVPKLVVVMLTLMATGPLLGAQLVRFTQAVFLATSGVAASGFN